MRKKVILYVDDDPDDREFLTDAIQKQNPEVQVVLAENGMDALEQLVAMKESGANLPCLIILDINMPFLDGRETFERMRKDSVLQKVPIMIFSSSEKPNDKALFAAKGIEYISKPTDINCLYTIASRIVHVCS